MRRILVADYIKRIRNKELEKREKEVINDVEDAYVKWKKSLSFYDFLVFLDKIHSNESIIMKNLGGFPQSYGRFRAIAFEEFIFDFLKKIFSDKEDIIIYWNTNVVIKIPIDYYLRPDFTIIRNGRNIVFVEAKIEVDSQRIKSTTLDYLILKKNYSNTLNVLIYHTLDGDRKLIELARHLSFDYIICLKENSDEELKIFREWLYRSI